MKKNLKKLKVDRTVLTVTDLNKSDEDQYWLSKTPIERLQAIEYNRQAVYGYGNNPPRFQRFLEIVGR